MALTLMMQAPAIGVGPVVPSHLMPSGQAYIINAAGQIFADPRDVSVLEGYGFVPVSTGGLLPAATFSGSELVTVIQGGQAKAALTSQFGGGGGGSPAGNTGDYQINNGSGGFGAGDINYNAGAGDTVGLVSPGGAGSINAASLQSVAPGGGHLIVIDSDDGATFRVDVVAGNIAHVERGLPTTTGLTIGQVWQNGTLLAVGLTGDTGTVLGSATGGPQGAGTINTQGNYDNGVRQFWGVFTVSDLASITSPQEGDSAWVSDALTPTFLNVLVGGGTVSAPARFDGTNWICA